MEDWTETTYGARWMNTPSPQRHQIWRMSCIHCAFYLDPGDFRRYDETRKDHPQPYGNLASISHARKVMKDHMEDKHSNRFMTLLDGTIVHKGDKVRAKGEGCGMRVCTVLEVMKGAGVDKAVLTAPTPFGTIIRTRYQIKKLR